MQVINLVNLLVEASGLGDDIAARQLLSEMSVEEASRVETRKRSANFGYGALHRAKTPAVARVLLNFGLDVNLKAAKGQTPLHTLCDNLPVLLVLLENGAKLLEAEDGSSALESVVLADSVECAKVLLDRFPHAINLQNHSGNTPLHLVGSRRMAELLLKHGAKVSIENQCGKIPLESATERAGDGDHAAITELLLDVSEERGLRFRGIEPSTPAEEEPVDEGVKGDANNAALDWQCKSKKATGKLGGKWNLVREHFKINATQSCKTTAKLGALCEWKGGAFVSLRTLIQDSDNNASSIRSVASEAFGARQESDPLMNFEDDDEEENGSSGDSQDEDEDDAQSHFYRTFFEMAIVERPHLALRMLDHHRTFLYAQGTSRMHQYDFSLLGGVNCSSSALRLMVENDRKELVAHDLCQWIFNAKWLLFSFSQIAEEGLFYCAFILSVALSTLLDDAGLLMWISQATAFLLAMRFLLRFGLEAKRRVEKGERGAIGAVMRSERITGPVFVLVPLCLVLRWFTQVDPYALEALASVLLWTRVLIFLEAFNETIGLTMRIVRTMAADIGVFVMVQLVFLVAFAHAMTITFQGSADPPSEFATFQASIATLLFFIFSLDASSVFNEQDYYIRVMAMVFLAMFESLVVVLFLNLVIAVMSSSYDRVMSEAKEEWLLVRAKVCIRMEDQRMVEFGSVVSKRWWRGTQRHLWAKTKRFVVKERADGQNVVAIPTKMLPEETWVNWLYKAVTRCTLPGAAASPPAASPPAAAKGYGTLDKEEGRSKAADKPVQIGTFARGSKASTSSSPSFAAATMGEELAQLSDEKLLESIRDITVEMERRRQAAAAAQQDD
ncbi:hypothetical protein BASA81_002113 [Batrachochytrium salamandrivorans]|nr:hypothetical protein BASA81_002113 [Batrachochytrium salamandrivorans]